MNHELAAGPNAEPPGPRDLVGWPSGAASPPSSLNADAALRYCVSAFGGQGPRPLPRSFWSWLEPQWRGRMESPDSAPLALEPAAALRALAHSHRAQARVDFQHLHASWIERARQDESPAVRRLLDPAAAPSGADPQVAGWVRVLATERLVGGEPAGGNDPPAILVLGGLSPRDGLRLADAVGHAKLALAAASTLEPTTRHVERATWFRNRLRLELGGEEENLRQWARREVELASRSHPSPRRLREHLGLITLARLLTACEPFRVRWALQHLPYSLAKRFRALMSSPGQNHPRLQQIEGVILRTAWERLAQEGQIRIPYPMHGVTRRHVY